jgi:hypothetical protein
MSLAPHDKILWSQEKAVESQILAWKNVLRCKFKCSFINTDCLEAEKDGWRLLRLISEGTLDDMSNLKALVLAILKEKNRYILVSLIKDEGYKATRWASFQKDSNNSGWTKVKDID